MDSTDRPLRNAPHFGYAPQVRIGIHTGEATEHDGDRVDGDLAHVGRHNESVGARCREVVGGLRRATRTTTNQYRRPSHNRGHPDHAPGTELSRDQN